MVQVMKGIDGCCGEEEGGGEKKKEIKATTKEWHKTSALMKNTWRERQAVISIRKEAEIHNSHYSGHVGKLNM